MESETDNEKQDPAVSGLFERFVMWLKSEKLYTVTFYAKGYMGNEYKVNSYTEKISKKEIEEFHSVAKYVFSKHYHELKHAYKAINGDIQFKARTEA